MSSGKLRSKSASANAQRELERELERLARMTPLERMVKALELGRRGRRLRDMARGDARKGAR